MAATSISPRFMTDEELRGFFGLSDRALTRLRATALFPKRDELINKTDRRAVELFFDRRSGLASPVAAINGMAAPDGEENF